MINDMQADINAVRRHIKGLRAEKALDRILAHEVLGGQGCEYPNCILHNPKEPVREEEPDPAYD